MLALKSILNWMCHWCAKYDGMADPYEVGRRRRVKHGEWKKDGLE